MSQREKRRNILTGAIMLLTTIPFFLSTGLAGEELYLIPYLALGLMALSGASVLLKALLAPADDGEEREEKDADKQPVTAKEIVLCFLFLFAAVALMGVVGTYAVLFALLFLSHLYICRRKGNLSVLRSLIFSVVAIAVVYLVFGLMLGLRLPGDVWLF